MVKTNNIIVSGYIGFENFGDEAIFYALSNHLKQLNLNVSAICNNPEKIKEKYDVKAYYYMSFKEVFLGILKNDILISGGGSLLQNKTSNKSLFYYLFIIFLAKILFKKVIIFAQGIEPIKGFVPRLFVKIALKLSDKLTVRDYNSKNLLANWGLKSELVSDPIYSILEKIKIQENKEGLIVQLRNFKGMSEEFIENLAEAVFENFKEQKIKVVSFQDEYDYDICKFFVRQLKQYNLNPEFLHNLAIRQTIDLVNSAQYMISTRLHGVFISQALKTKTLALVYDDKIQSVADELNIENIEITCSNEQKIKEKVNALKNSNNEFKQYRKFNWQDFDTEFLK